MRMNLRKRVCVAALAVVLLGNSLYMPENTIQVSAQEVNPKEGDETKSNDIASENEMEKQPEELSREEALKEELSKAEQSEEGSVKEEQEETATADGDSVMGAEEQKAAVGSELSEEQKAAVESELSEEQKATVESELSETQKAAAVSELLHIGQTEDMSELPYPGNPDCVYDKPVSLIESSKVRLFADWSMEAAAGENDAGSLTERQYSYIGGPGREEESDVLKCPYEGTLTWSILRGEEGTQPGTTNLFIEKTETENSVNDEDDWTEFETVSFSPGFTIQEEEDENSIFYQTLTITARDQDITGKYDYYIRATFRYRKGQSECTAVTTVPVIMSTAVSEEAPAAEAAGEALEGAGAEEASTVTDVDGDWKASEEKEDSRNDVSGQDILAYIDESAMGTIGMSAEEQDSLMPLQEENGEEDSEENAQSDPQETVIGISKLTLNKTSAVMNPGDTIKPSVTVVPEGLGLNISWSSSNSDVADVGEDGSITALAEGTAVITAACGGKTAGIRIDVAETDAVKNGDRPTNEKGELVEISDEIWVAGFEREGDALTYTGGKITQDLRIYHKGTLLKEKTDYVLTYKNNTNAAAYNASKAPSVTITMKGQYSGSRTLYFTIAPRDIDEDRTQGYEQVIQYSKKLTISAPTLYYGSKKLVSGKDFVCDYSSLPENYKLGASYEEGVVYEYIVNGIGNYTGSFTMKLAVIRDKTLNFGSAVVTLDKKQYEYHGEALSVSDVGIVSVKFGKNILDERLYEYQVYADRAGTGYIEVYPSEAGRSEGYRGIKKVNFKVVGDRSIKNVVPGENWQSTITFSKSEINNKGGICQKETGVLVFYNEGSSEPLTEGLDYTVKYSSNKKVGTATVTFTGMGRYTGTLKKTYKITANADLYLTWKSTDDEGNPVAVYRKGGAVPEFELKELPEGEAACILSSKTDYTVKVRNNTKLGTMTCEITGKGNYKGYKSITEIAVIAADISEGTISVPDKAYSSKNNAWKSTVTIKDVNGKKLTAGTDYNKAMIYTYEGMEEGLPPKAGSIVYVTVQGINNYAGSSVTGSYRIYSTSISRLTVVIDAQEYTGKEIELSADDIHVYASKSDSKKGIEIAEPCYEILSYSNNIKAGTAKVTLRGTGDYGGTRVCTFKITKKKYLTTRVTKISLDETSISLGIGSTRQLTATIVPDDAWNKTVIWSTSNSKIATVSENGVITAVKSGTATITATAQDTGKKAACKVKVSVIAVTSFVLNATEINQYEGTTYQLTATEIRPENATYSTIQWESTNPEAASVDQNGLVSLNKAGMAVIKAYADNRRFVEKCLVFVSREEAEKEPEEAYLTPQMFRTGDEEDDTEAFNEAIRNLNENCDTLFVPAGIYKINAQTGIRLKSNMNFLMSPDAVIKAVNNSAGFYDVVYVNNISNVTISGGQIMGERYGHTGTSGEWGMGIGIYDSSNVNITDTAVFDCWGDGIYIGSHHEEDSIAGCEQITITNCNLYNNRRNNLSIVCGDYITVDNCRLDNAGGTAPEYGIDIETNNPKNPCEHITISGSTFTGNGQGSIGIITAADDVLISDCTLNGTFINYAGTNVKISDSVINGEVDARIGVLLEDGTKINDGGEEEDILIASFSAASETYTIGEYGINASNPMSWSMIEDSESQSGKVLRMKRMEEGTKETGYYLNLSELTENGSPALEKGVTYRFEYVVRGSGQWGIKTDQTGWYPCVPMADKFSTGIVTYTASQAKSCRLILYAVDMTKDMYLELDSVNIYKVR